jgi:zinc protease
VQRDGQEVELRPKELDLGHGAGDLPLLGETMRGVPRLHIPAATVTFQIPKRSRATVEATVRVIRRLIVVLLVVFAAPGLQSQSPFKIDYETYTLANGLQVVLHLDRSDPLVAVAVQYHVGSNREQPGRTGFAHLFEHMMFQSSQHVGEDQFFAKIQAAGGTLNGGTNSDATTYYEVVPNNALEMALWLEADRMGYLLPTVTYQAFLNQQDVVQNEKRQRVDNVPYGHTNYVLDKLTYPADHPYSWQVIGSFEDLARASIPDIHDFFKTWYGPNNATLVVAGDFDVATAKRLVDKYFGEIPSRGARPDPEPLAVKLNATVRAYHEDNFARSPELNMAYPTVEDWHNDAYALQYLGLLLSDGRNSPLYKVIVEERKLAPQANAFSGTREIAGTFRFRVRAFPNIKLSDVEQAVFDAMQRFETDKFTDADLARIRARVETGFYNGLSSVLAKSFQLATYNEYAGSPGYATTDLQRILAVKADDVWRVYRAYLKDKPYILTSFVPKGQVELVAANSERFPVQEEAIAAAGVTSREADTSHDMGPLPSSFDRSVEPERESAPALALPATWTHTYRNGLRIYGIRQAELPLVNFSLTLQGGLLLDDPVRVGTANLITDLMMEGTRRRTPVELEQAIDNLGANVGMFTGREAITIQANGLASKLPEIYALFEEILLEPRWDETEFARIKRETIESINRSRVSPAAVASNVFNRLAYGDGHIFANPTSGEPETVEALTIDDLKRFYDKNYSPAVAHITVVGAISREDAIRLFQPLERKWTSREVTIPTYRLPAPLSAPRLYFVDIPGARQSEIRIGHLGLAESDPDYYGAIVMNYKLGGAFNGRVNMILREEKGFTYGARTGFSGGTQPGTFVASAGVRANSTAESVGIFRDQITRYLQGIPQEDLEFTKGALIQSNALRFETLGALGGLLNDMATYGWSVDFVSRREQFVRDLTLEQHRALAGRFIHPDQLIYLVVGDAATQLEPLRSLGLGDPTLLDVTGRPPKAVP